MSLPELQVGDVLLYYNPKSIFNWAIALKTYNLVAHVEIYVGNGQSIASRDGQGVDRYSLRTDGLIYIRRPFEQLKLDEAMDWFEEEAQGQGYDWKGLLCFTLAVKQGSCDKMFCSEFAVRWFRMAGLNIVAEDYDADKTAPAQFRQTPALRTIYSRAEQG